MRANRSGLRAPLLVAVGLAMLAPHGAAGADEFYRTRWALLIGVGQFSNPTIPRLNFCGSDVSAMRDLLVDRAGFPADHITTLVDAQATRQGVLRELGRLADSNLVTAQDAVLVYFSGHGQTVPLPRGGEMGFLIPHDAAIDPANASNPALYYETCIGMDEIRRLSSLIPARHVLFLVDACYSGLAVAATRGAAQHASLATVAARPVRQIIVAGLKDEKAQESAAWGHGAFTYSLLEGLGTGAADLDRDGVATGMELATYLRGSVPRISPQTPQYAAFDGDGEFLLPLPAGASAQPATPVGPRIALHEPRDLAEGSDEVSVMPLGDEVAVQGWVTGPCLVTSLAADGVPLRLHRVGPQETQGLLRDGETGAVSFDLWVPVLEGDAKAVVLEARDTSGACATRRLVLRAQASDDQAPEVRIAEVRTYDDAGQELDWRALTMASKALTMASKDIVLAGQSGQRHTLYGIARDDRAVVRVTLDGAPVQTRPASKSELEGLGWSFGVVFEGPISPAPDGPTTVAVTAQDAAGNESAVSITVKPKPAEAPQIIIREPRSARGTGLILPRALGAVTVEGYVHGSAPIATVTVDGTPATLRPATPDELATLSWEPPVTFFSSQPAVAATGTTISLLVEATDQTGAKAHKEVLVQRPGPTLRPQLTVDQPDGYRVGDRVHLFLSCSRDAYVYVFHLEPDGSFALFLPNPVEPDGLLAGGTPRVFPSPAEETRWEGQYGLAAQEPTGTDTVCLLAISRPLPTESVYRIASHADLIQALGLLAGPAATTDRAALSLDDQIAGLAEDLGGTWQRVRYEVRPR